MKLKIIKDEEKFEQFLQSLQELFKQAGFEEVTGIPTASDIANKTQTGENHRLWVEQGQRIDNLIHELRLSE